MKRRQEADGAVSRPGPEDFSATEELIRRYRMSGDEALREQAVLDNLGLVYYAYGRMKVSLPSGMEPEDAISFGICGLIETVDRFDVTKGHFASLAYPRIQGAIYDGISRFLWNRRSDQRIFYAWNEEREKLERDLGRNVSVDEVAETLSLSGAKRLRYLTVAANSIPLSLSAEETDLGDRRAESSADYRLLEEDRRVSVLRAVERLPERERELIRLHYFQGLSLRECARRLHYGTTTAFELHRSALRRLRVHMDENDY